MITLPTRRKLTRRTNCKDCDVKLTEENRIRHGGKTQARCKPCNRKYLKKYNDKRYKAIKENKLW